MNRAQYLQHLAEIDARTRLHLTTDEDITWLIAALKALLDDQEHKHRETRAVVRSTPKHLRDREG